MIYNKKQQVRFDFYSEKFKAALEQVYNSIDSMCLKSIHFLDRELIWIKRKNGIWISLQDCRNDFIYNTDTASYDYDLFLLHIIKSDGNPNEDRNIMYRSSWVTYNLYQVGILEAMHEFELRIMNENEYAF